MATIILEPGEIFEHLHGEASLTKLLSGAVEFSDEQGTRMLVVGEKVLVPSMSSHSIRNIGETPANVACLHGPDLTA